MKYTLLIAGPFLAYIWITGFLWKFVPVRDYPRYDWWRHPLEFTTMIGALIVLFASCEYVSRLQKAAHESLPEPPK